MSTSRKRSSDETQSGTRKVLCIDPQLNLELASATAKTAMPLGIPGHDLGELLDVPRTAETEHEVVMPPQLKTPVPSRRRRHQPSTASPQAIRNSPIIRSLTKKLKRGTPKTTDIDHFFERYESEKGGRGGAKCKSCKSLFSQSNGMKPDDGRTWVYQNSGTGTLRTHIEKYHADEYLEACQTHGWKIGIQSLCEKQKLVKGPNRRGTFTTEGLIQHLVRWIVADDQSLNVVECPEFRELLLYVNESLADKDIPHRTTIRNIVVKMWSEEFSRLKCEMAVGIKPTIYITTCPYLLSLKTSLGKISFTADIWTDSRLRPFLAITAHWIRRREDHTLALRADLIAFHYLPGSHDGKSLCTAAMKMLERAHVINKIGWWTLDNASNNNTFMVELEKVLSGAGVVFSSENNRVRCFAHVINIAVQHVLALLKTAPEGDIMARLHGLVNAIRTSSDRRVAFLDTVRQGNASKLFQPPVPEVELLREVETRWDSAHGMLRTTIPARPAIEAMMIQKKYREIRSKNLTDEQWTMAQKILDILDYPHLFQHLMTGEATPTLSSALPAFQCLQDRWEDHAGKHPDMAKHILGGMERLDKYHEKAGRTRAYVIALVLNPTIKLSFIRKHWSPIEQEMAEIWIKDELQKYRVDSPMNLGTTPLTKLSDSARVKLGLIDVDDDLDGEEISVDDEYSAYIGSSTRRIQATQPVLTFWQEHEHTYPTWFRMALDYLPIQASSVPCERVFSSSSETMTKRRNRLKPDVMEALQMLKFRLKKDRLNFTKDWETPITDMTVDPDNSDVLGEVLSTQSTELDSMLDRLLGEED